MAAARVLLVLAALLAAGCLAPPPPPPAPPVPVLAPGPYESWNETVTSFDGTKIAITVHKPLGASADARVPVLLHSHGWSGARCGPDCAKLPLLAPVFDAGLGLVSMDQRGHGESGGESHILDPEFEGRDALSVVDWIAAQPWVFLDAPGDPRLGAIGYSYGGAFQLLAALEETRLRGATRFDALAPEITWHDLAQSLAPNGVPKSGWLTALLVLAQEAEVRLAPWLRDGLADAYARGEIDGAVRAKLARHSPAWYPANGIRLDVPVFLLQSAQDTLFPLDEALRTWDTVLTPDARAESLLVAHRSGHTLPAAQRETAAPSACPDGVFGREPADVVAWLAARLLGTPVDAARVRLAATATECAASPQLRVAFATARVAPPTPLGAPLAGAPLALKLEDGPLSVAGVPRLTARVTAAGAEARVFFALAVGTGAGDLRILGDQWTPARGAGTVALDDAPMMGVLETVPVGRSLYLVASPAVEAYATSGSRTGGGLVLASAEVALPLRAT